MSIFSIFSCSNDKKYLSEHKVLLCSINEDKSILLPNVIEKEKGYNINFKDASDIYTKFLYTNGEIKELNYDKVIYPKLIIDDNYVYSFYNMKEGKVATFGVWINAYTGKITHGKDEIWLYEKDILKSMENDK